MDPKLMKACVVEGLGTFWLTFIGVGAIVASAAGGGGNLVAIALAHGLALAMAVYVAAPISGGHINPAITFGFVFTGKIDAKTATHYIIFQCAGAILAAWLITGLFPAGAVDAVRLGATLGTEANRQALGWQSTMGIEFILTFFLMTTIYATAVDSRAPKNIFGLCIGLTVAFCILAAGPITGASMNPARSIGPALVGGYWDWHWVYWAGPFGGSFVAAWIYDQYLMGNPKTAPSSRARRRK